VTRARPGWEFPYAALGRGATADDDGPFDLVVATGDATPRSEIEEAVRTLVPGAVVTPILSRTPLFWTRIRAARGADSATRAAVAAALVARGITVRYVASAIHASGALGPPLRFAGASPARATSWSLFASVVCDDDPPSDGRWFLREADGGVAVDRAACGVGKKTRLAVIDDDAAEADSLRLDALVPIGIATAPQATSHGALMVAWAVGCRGFQGVAPGSSPRLYCIPKPGLDVLSLPLAVALDGADVIVCATYVEGSTSPMMDDALAVAARLGRRGLGTAVVIPTGREASSAEGFLHSSWTLALGDPACDPRVFCIGPGARDGQWFLWRDRRGRLRPFANRGPSVRWLAPGDDVAYPFRGGDAKERLFHAESSGASAIAAGALLLVLGANPTLRLSELEAIVTRTAEPLSPDEDTRREALADAWDILPTARDADGHNAKHGYGRINARRACLAASDPIALGLLAMGEAEAASAASGIDRSRPWSRRLARWTVRAVVSDASIAHHLSVLLRHARLVTGREDRQRAQGEGSLARQIALFLRSLTSSRIRPPSAMAREVSHLVARLAEPAVARGVEAAIHAALPTLWRGCAPDGGASEPPGPRDARFGADPVRL
jgi:hypothetical protein